MLLLLWVTLVGAAPAKDVPIRTSLRVGLRSLDGKALSLTVGRGTFQLRAGKGRILVSFGEGQGFDVQIRPDARINVVLKKKTLVVRDFLLLPKGRGGSLFVKSGQARRYLWGSLSVSVRRGRLRAVETLPLEDYLLGVVPAEMPASWGMEALKSQAILARTYTLVHMGERHKDYDLCDLSHCQVYLGQGISTAATNRAVRETAGRVILFRGRPAEVFYHSTCGGATVGPSLVFGQGMSGNSPSQPGVQDKTQKGVLCRLSPHYHWEYRVDKNRFQRFLGNLGPQASGLGKILKVRILKRDKTRRVEIIELVGRKGSLEMSGHDFRMRFLRSFSGDSLKSTMFSLNIDKGEVVFRGRGFGHGVGLCQWGAQALAKQGYDFRKILLHYFPWGKVGRLTK